MVWPAEPQLGKFALFPVPSNVLVHYLSFIYGSVGGVESNIIVSLLAWKRNKKRKKMKIRIFLIVEKSSTTKKRVFLSIFTPSFNY